MKKRFLALSLAMLMVFSMLSTSAFAAETGSTTYDPSLVSIDDFLEPDVTTTYLNGFTVEEAAPLDLSGIDPSNIIELPDIDAATYDVNSEPAPALNNDDAVLPTSYLDLENAESLDDAIISGSSMARSSTYDMASMSNVMGEGQTQQLYTITVPNGVVVQAEMQVPKNPALDYSLYLCTYDDSDSSLTIVSRSSYATNSNYLAESVCAINTSGSDLVYYIVVDSNNNPSTEDYYTISVSLGGDVDAFEPNDSAFYAFDFPEMSSTTTVTVPGSLHSPIDNDWFGLYVSSTSEFAKLELSNIPSNVVVEAYTFTSDAQPVLQGSTANGNTLPIIAGYNYFRIVYNQKGTFAHTDYSIKFAPVLNVKKIVTLIAVNGYCQRKSSLFADRITRYLYVMGANVQVKVLYASANDLMVKTDDTIYVTIDNPQWTNTNVRYEYGNTTISGKDTCIVNLRVPTFYGTTKYNFVYTTIESRNYGTLANHVQMAMLNKYDDGELNRPCDHNGTCGYK